MAKEARRIDGMLHEPPEERRRRKQIETIAAHGGEITPRTQMRSTRLITAGIDLHPGPLPGDNTTFPRSLVTRRRVAVP